MTRRHVLAAIARGIEQGDEFAARALFAKGDPIGRRLARRRFERALIDAALACDAAGMTKPAPAHLLRVAALSVARRRDVAAGDVDAVTAAYERLPKARAPRVPLFTSAALLAIVAIAGASALYLTTRPGPKPRTYERKMPPPSPLAFKEGGVPLSDPALDQLLAEKLTDAVVEAANHDRRTAMDLEQLRDTELHHGAALQTAWTQAFDAYRTAVETGDPNPDPLREAVRELTSELGKAGLGYFLEGRIRGGYPLIQAYRVVEVVYVVAGGHPQRVLSLRRLDRLNTAYAALGLTDEDVGDPVLHLDRIDEHVASVEMPVLADGAPYRLAEDGWLATDDGKALATAAGDAVRREYAVVLGEDMAPAARIAKLLAERADIVESWRSLLSRRNVRFSSADDLFLPPDLLQGLANVVPKYQQERVYAIEDELAELEAPRIHARVRELVAATVRRHEAQHGFDYDRDTELRYPAPLQDLLGPPHDDEGNEIAIVTAARAELSAYLSQVINDPMTPQAAFWHLARQTFSRDRWGTGEFYAGLVVIEGLARHLGATLDGPQFLHGEIERTRLSKAALKIAGASDAQLHDAAKALWLELYGEPPTVIADTPATWAALAASKPR